jgi:predicted DNA-binding transcriptional regulator AlpA
MEGATDRFLKAKQVCEMAGISRDKLHRMVKAKQFPPPFDVLGGRTGWRYKLSEIQAWMDEKQRVEGH